MEQDHESAKRKMDTQPVEAVENISKWERKRYAPLRASTFKDILKINFTSQIDSMTTMINLRLKSFLPSSKLYSFSSHSF